MMKIKLNKGRIFFTSDTHYGHTNICRGVSNWRDENGNVPIHQTRDFETLEQMNDKIVESINSVVGEDDTLFHLGDWSFGGFDNIEILRNRIVCKNIHLVFGNHDHFLINNKNSIQDLFSSAQQYLELEIIIPSEYKNVKHSKYNFILNHYPIVSWNMMNDGAIHLHGHTHLPYNLKLMPGRGMDCGIDGNINFQPYSLEEILKLINSRPIKSMFVFDHHVERFRVTP